MLDRYKPALASLLPVAAEEKTNLDALSKLPESAAGL